MYNFISMIKWIIVKHSEILFILVLTLISTFFYFYKLDYAYFFTDEILYVNTGVEHLRGEYNNVLQAPLLGKYIAGIAGLINEDNVNILRAPFALLGVLSVLLVYKILSDHEGKIWGFFGGILYLSSPLLYSSTRMVMLESPMHFLWLLAHLFLLKALVEPKKLINSILAGFFIGFGVATKYSTLVFYPFILILYFVIRKSGKDLFPFKNLMSIYLSSFVGFGIVYSHFVYSTGLSGIKLFIKDNLQTFTKFGIEGKPHVIDGKLYSKSPWWTNIYFYFENNNFYKVFLTFWSAISAFLHKSFLSFYFGLFGLLTLIFMQTLDVKSARYMSSVELSMIFLVVIFIKHLYSYKDKLISILLTIFIAVILIQDFGQIINQKPTEYNALFMYLGKMTSNFTDGNKIYIYGSSRSTKWYSKEIADEILESDRDLDAMCSEFKNYTIFIFDLSDLPRNPTNKLISYVQENREMFTFERKFGFDIYKLIPGFNPVFECRDQIIVK